MTTVIVDEMRALREFGSRALDLLWYPHDPPESKSQATDGPGALLGHVAAHLIKDEWYWRTEQWPGAEAEHGDLRAEQE